MIIGSSACDYLFDPYSSKDLALNTAANCLPSFNAADCFEQRLKVLKVAVLNKCEPDSFGFKQIRNPDCSPKHLRQNIKWPSKCLVWNEYCSRNKINDVERNKR